MQLPEQVKVIISGNIAAGKSTLVKKLSETYSQAIFIPEQFQEIKNLTLFFQEEANPYKQGTYNKYCINMQTEFLEQRYHNELEIAKHPHQIIFCDRSFFEDYHVFAKAYLHSGKITQDELDVYFDKFQHYSSYVKQPDIFIYLKAHENTLLERILQRGRDFERTTSHEYLKILNQSYDSFFEYVKDNFQSKVIEVDTENKNQNQVYQEVMEKMNHLVQTAQQRQLYFIIKSKQNSDYIL